MALRIIALALAALWLLLVLLGKGGLVHTILLNAIAVAVVSLVCDCRRRVIK